MYNSKEIFDWISAAIKSCTDSIQLMNANKLISLYNKHPQYDMWYSQALNDIWIEQSEKLDKLYK